MLELFPFLSRRAFYGLLVWQWLAIPALVLFAWSVGRTLTRLGRAILKHLTSRTHTSWDDALVERLSGPATAAIAIGVINLSLRFLSLGPAEALAQKTTGTALYGCFLWGLVRMVDVTATAVVKTPWAVTHPASSTLVPLGARVGKVFVAAVAVVAFISQLGYPVTSLLAGLGIGGLALALAAQKTVENLFGAFAIGLDQPFREGDFVKIEDFVGTVEVVGLRSTRIRSLDRTLITLPNARVADSRIESYTARDRMRLAATIAVVYGTTAAQMREVLAGFERILRAHPKIWPDAVIVRFKELASSSLDIEIMAWFETADWGEFQAIRQEILIAFMEVVERANTSFAFPTRTVHLAPSAGAQSAMLGDGDRLA